ncbi:eCIS core domain-containing protein [Spirosoma taeanense]|uniref:eCIS core domain-containing protein n=1 Tax=Spirosoma taeanense TaxID=2735870 RepID=UPI001F0389CC|nr:DUF4157 domain-containing protein [Spirosoma taeanense]
MKLYRKESPTLSAQEGPAFVAPLLNQPAESFFGPLASSPSLEISQPGDAHEREADAVAEQVNASGYQLRSGFGSNLSGVRLHTDQRAAELSQALNADAFTLGRDIYFAEGKYAPQSSEGQKLLAHELTHVAQQQRGSARLDRKVSDADVEADFQAWATKATRKVNKGDPQDLWDFVYSLIFDPTTYLPLAKPAKAAAVPEWQKKFEKAEVVARWLFQIKSTSKSTDVQGQADSRGFGVLDALVQAGFVGQAMAQSSGLSDEKKKLLFETVLKTPSAASATDLETIVTAQCTGVADPASVPIVQTLTDGNKSPLKSLDAARTKAILNVLIKQYGSKDSIIKAIAQVLMFNPAIRVAISDALMASQIGSPDLLFKVLKQPYFVEPGYEGAELLQALLPSGKSTTDYDTERMKNDMPWVYTYKQKYYVQFLIDLAKGQKITIAPPAKFDAPTLRSWLESNNANIAAAAQGAYASKPADMFELYRNISDIFFYHIPHDRNVDPDLEGKISHLVPGEPSKQRLEADCDVFATYAMRLFTSTGFEPVGYLAIVPTGADKARAAHVAGLVRKSNQYYIINNKNILNPGLADTKPNDKKADAIKKLYSMALADAYASPYPTSVEVFYEDAGAKGQMSPDFKKQDRKLLRTDIP